MPTFLAMLDAVHGLPRRDRACRLRHLLRRSTRRTHRGSRGGKARVGGYCHYPRRRVAATPIMVAPPVPIASTPPPLVVAPSLPRTASTNAGAPHRIQVQGIQYCTHHGWTAVVTLAGEPCSFRWRWSRRRLHSSSHRHHQPLLHYLHRPRSRHQADADADADAAPPL